MEFIFFYISRQRDLASTSGYHSGEYFGVGRGSPVGPLACPDLQKLWALCTRTPSNIKRENMRAVATWDQTPDICLWPIACEAGRAKETPETGDAGPVDQKLESRPHALQLYTSDFR